MKKIFLWALLCGWGVFSLPAVAQSGQAPASTQSGPAAFPLAGDWEGVAQAKGTVYHLVLHFNTTPEGKMTALMDYVDQDITGVPAIGGSFDGTHLTLHFFYWKPDAKGDVLDEKVAVYDATVSASGAEMTGTWTQEGTWPVNFKRLTWQARNPKPAPPTIFDGDWIGTEYETKDLQLHFILHISNTEDGLMILMDCPEEKFKGARASKISYGQDSRQLTFYSGSAVFTGKMTADGKGLDTSMTEPGYHFQIHFDRMVDKKTGTN